MDALSAIVDEARRRGLRPWLAIKEKLAARALEVMSDAGDQAVLQGGAALHFAYGSSRLSADVDFVGLDVARAIEVRGPALARAAGELLVRPCSWSLSRAGRLVRGKLTVDIDAARRVVLPIEAYPVPVRLPAAHGPWGAVEDPAEIAADKIVATADRLARRGTVKTTDLYDLWYVAERLGAPLPEMDLVAAKAADYAQPARAADLGVAVRSVPLEELQAALEGVLPAAQLEGVDAGLVRETAARVVSSYSRVL